MSVALLPAYCPGTTAHRWEMLTEAPAYVRSSGATRWHRARSGRRYDSGRISYSYWCGANYGDYGVESIGVKEDLCGTCEGRFLAQQEENALRYTPIASLPPRRCPASGSSYWIPGGPARHFPCPVCGEDVTAYAPWHSMARVRRHAPGSGLVAPCQMHGWFNLTYNADRSAVVCSCTLREER